MKEIRTLFKDLQSFRLSYRFIKYGFGKGTKIPKWRLWLVNCLEKEERRLTWLNDIRKLKKIYEHQDKKMFKTLTDLEQLGLAYATSRGKTTFRSTYLTNSLLTEFI
jgi:hypothetical protein